MYKYQQIENMLRDVEELRFTGEEKQKEKWLEKTWNWQWHKINLFQQANKQVTSYHLQVDMQDRTYNCHNGKCYHYVFLRI